MGARVRGLGLEAFDGDAAVVFVDFFAGHLTGFESIKANLDTIKTTVVETQYIRLGI